MIKYILHILKYSWPSAIIAAIIFYICCLLSSSDIPKTNILHADKIMHFSMYFGLSLISSVYYIFKKDGKIIILKLIIFAITIPILYGGIIEILQYIYFDRSGDWFDFIANATGSLASLPLSLWFRRVLLNQQDNQEETYLV